MLRTISKILTVLILLIPAGSVRADVPEDDSLQIETAPVTDSLDTIDINLPSDSTLISIEEISPDSVILEPMLYRPGPDSVIIESYQSEKEIEQKTGSPTIALFKSVAFPGWGQFSNKRYFKAAVIFAVESYFIYRAVEDAQDASDWRKKWLAEEENTVLRTEYFNKYVKYRDDRNTNLWYTAAIVFISMFDAYVDAHLQGFPKRLEEKDKLSFDIKPGQETKFEITYRF